MVPRPESDAPRSRRRFRWWWIISVVAVPLLLAWAWIFREPRYQGMRLGTWLEQLDDPAAPAYTQAVHAVQEIGAAGVPTLLKLIPRQEPPKSALKKLLEELSIIEPHPYSLQKTRTRVWRAFEALGPKGSSAIPQLTKMMNDPDPNASGHSISILGVLGPAAIPALRTALTHSNSLVRAGALYSFYQRDIQDPETFAMSLRLLTDPKPEVRKPALLVLCRYTNSWNVIGPAWVPMLHDTNADIRFTAMQMLYRFGSQTRQLAPALMQMLSETETSAELRLLIRDLKVVEVPFNKIFACLLNRLETADPNLRPHVAFALADYGAAASNAVSAIEQWIERSSPDLNRTKLLDALSRIDLAAATRLGFNTNRMSASPSPSNPRRPPRP